jgi:hypothetical protein
VVVVIFGVIAQVDGEPGVSDHIIWIPQPATKSSITLSLDNANDKTEWRNRPHVWSIGW